MAEPHYLDQSALFMFFFGLTSLVPQIKRRKNTGKIVNFEVGFIVSTCTQRKEFHCLKYIPVKLRCFSGARMVAGGGFAMCCPAASCLEAFALIEWYLISVKFAYKLLFIGHEYSKHVSKSHYCPKWCSCTWDSALINTDSVCCV